MVDISRPLRFIMNQRHCSPFHAFLYLEGEIDYATLYEYEPVSDDGNQWNGNEYTNSDE